MLAPSDRDTPADLGIDGGGIRLATTIPGFPSLGVRARVQCLPGGPWHEGTVIPRVMQPGLVQATCPVPGAGVTVSFTWQQDETASWIDERVSVRCDSSEPVTLERLDIGLVMDMPGPGWELVAIPFTIQPNGREFRFTMTELARGGFKPLDYRTDCPYWPDPCDGDELRSEAWYLGSGKGGLLVIKHNPSAIEYAMIRASDGKIRLGGAGFCLYHEPVRASSIGPDETYTFGTTRYVPVTSETPEQDAFQAHYRFLESTGHGIPDDYDPLVHWNELYDIGWYHSNAAKLGEHYSRDAVLEEAAKARACHAETLYLDPGWEIAEGTTTWDTARLGPVEDMIDELGRSGLRLAFRTVLRDYKGWLPDDWLVEHDEADVSGTLDWRMFLAVFREGCLVNKDFLAEKLARVLAIASKGMSFVMVDEHDWRGPCHATEHGHGDPSTAFDHANAVYDLCHAIREGTARATGKEIIVEAHDPVWPWAHRYCPTYFRQGFGTSGAYQENWGFEFMWNPIADLRSGKALSLYYYAASCPIPLYLHVNMAHDNEQCLFFWWAASTVRHLGIGGKDCNATICHTFMKHDVDTGAQFDRYATAMEEYMAWKPWFVRGRFTGIDEECHLHVLDGEPGGVVVAFNLDVASRERSWTIPLATLGKGITNGKEPVVKGATHHEITIDGGVVRLAVVLDAGSAARVYL